MKKSGDASVALVGFPSVGKSSLISQLTGAESEAGACLHHTDLHPRLDGAQGVKIQILDLPGLIKGASEGKGRGREILNVIRGSDMVLYVLDPFQESHFNVLDQELWRSGMRLNQPKPQVFIRRTDRGGIVVRSTLDQSNLEAVGAGYHTVIWNCITNVVPRSDATDDHIVDTLAGNRVYTRSVVVINKVDLANEEDLKRAEAMTRRLADIACFSKIRRRTSR